MVSGVHEWNRKIIDEFRANAGKVGGPFEGATMVLLTHTGRKTGEKRTNPLVYMADATSSSPRRAATPHTRTGT
jgi:hypothetical protein